MTLADDLIAEVRKIVRTDTWHVDSSSAVPDLKSLRMSNHGVRISATVLYADLAGSTRMVDSEKDTFAAEVYKSFLYCCGRIIRTEGGEITAYDGDRIMAIFVDREHSKTFAVRAAMKIHAAGWTVIQPTIDAEYGPAKLALRYGIGVDASTLLVARTGVRGDNDLVWVGRAANHAAKLSDVRDWPYAVHVTEEVHAATHGSVRLSSAQQNMWKFADAAVLPGRRVCKTNYTISL